jgi:hypothetical protein
MQPETIAPSGEKSIQECGIHGGHRHLPRG